MFKYLRTLNNSSHPTEVVTYIGYEGDANNNTINAGTIVSIVFDEVSTDYTQSLPMYLALTSKPKHIAKEIKLIRILSGMVLEADIEPDTDISNYPLGSICDALPDNTGKGTYVTNQGIGKFEVIDNSEVEKKGKVTVVVI